MRIYVCMYVCMYMCVMVGLLFSSEPEIATPPLNGLILPGVTRDSIIQLAKKWVRVVVVYMHVRFAHKCCSNSCLHVVNVLA